MVNKLISIHSGKSNYAKNDVQADSKLIESFSFEFIYFHSNKINKHIKNIKKSDENN